MGNPFASADVREEKLNLRISPPLFLAGHKKGPTGLPVGFHAAEAGCPSGECCVQPVIMGMRCCLLSLLKTVSRIIYIKYD